MISNILGLDSSLTAFGWCVVEVEDTPPNMVGVGVSFVAAGLIRTEKNHDAESVNADTHRRTHEIATALIEVFDRYAPRFVGIESLALPFTSGGAVLSRLGRVRGVVDGLCVARGVELVETSAQNLKEFATGNRKAEKEAMLNNAVRAFPGLGDVVGNTPSSLRDNLGDAAQVARWAASKWEQRRRAA